MALVGTVLPSPLRFNRLRSALRERYTLVPCSTWRALLTLCGEEPLSMVVVDLCATPDVHDGFDALREIQRRYHSVAIVLYVAMPPLQPGDLFEAGRFGLDGLIVAEIDDEQRRILEIVEQAEARGALTLLNRSLGQVKPTVRDATLLAVTRAHQRLSADGLAKIIGVRRKTLSERLTAAGFPPTQRLIAWGRLIAAARMLEDSERSADSIARALDYPSGSAFRNSCQRYVHAPPHQIRARGGAAYVIDVFLRQLKRPSASVP